MHSLLYRRLLSLPECAVSANEHQRGDAADFACRNVVPKWYHVTWLLLGIPPILFCAGYLSRLVGGHLKFLPSLAVKLLDISIAVLLTALITLVELWLLRRRALRLLRERLIWLGVPVCGNCGYDLRGQTEPRCPECGWGFDPKLMAGGHSAHEPPAATIRDADE